MQRLPVTMFELVPCIPGLRMGPGAATTHTHTLRPRRPKPTRKMRSGKDGSFTDKTKSCHPVAGSMLRWSMIALIVFIAWSTTSFLWRSLLKPKMKTLAGRGVR